MQDSKDKQLFEDALKAIGNEYGLYASKVCWHKESGVHSVDGEVVFSKLPQALSFEVKCWANHMNSEHLIFKFSKQGELKRMVLVADYINPAMAERFKMAGLQFMDTVGNIYLEQDNFFIYVKGNKKKAVQDNAGAKLSNGKAFTGKGLQVVYILLSDKSGLSMSYRELADRAEVSLGTVVDVFKDLEAQGFLLYNQKSKMLLNVNSLIRSWVDGYNHKLRGSKAATLWTGQSPDWWKDINWSAGEAVAGGEVAAAYYTNYLTVQTPLVYADSAAIERLVSQFRLRKARPGEHSDGFTIFVEPFISPEKLSGTDKGYAHPLLVYAELIASRDARNIDVAERLYERFIAH